MNLREKTFSLNFNLQIFVVVAGRYFLIGGKEEKDNVKGENDDMDQENDDMEQENNDMEQENDDMEQENDDEAHFYNVCVEITGLS